MKVYLAGPITGLTFEGADDWRQDMRAKFAVIGVNAVSPLRGKNYLKGIGKISGGQDYPHPMSTDKGVISRDSNDVRTSDLIFVNLLGADSVSSGTMIEVGMALALNKPIVVAMEREGNPHDRHMLRGAANWIVDDLDDAWAIAATVLGFDVDLSVLPEEPAPAPRLHPGRLEDAKDVSERLSREEEEEPVGDWTVVG